MKLTKLFFSVLTSTLTLSVLASKANAQANSLAGFPIVIPGDATDLSGQPNGVNGNRLGGFFSDLYYDRSNNVYYGLSDRGPGGGTIAYDTRVQKFTLDVNPNTGAISNFNLIQTILFTNPNQTSPPPISTNNYNGYNPLNLNGSKSVLGLSLDPEGFVVAPNGNFYVSDEYGPSVYEFTPYGSFIRAFNVPNLAANTNPINLIPKESNGTLNYVDGRNPVTNGRQDNRGFEGVAITPDGSKLLAMLQDPLVNEGQNPGNGNNDGRYSRNLRIVEFDTATGNSTAQYIYQLEDLASINARVPNNKFDPNQQGRSIGISAITAINDHEFLVIERDNRGIGIDAPTAAAVANNPVASKRIYKIDITGATDVRNTSLTGTNALNGIVPVSKSLFLNIQDELQMAIQLVPEKIEGLAIGPQLNDGSYALVVGTDNDYSVTQNGSNVQFNVCTNLLNQSSNVDIQNSCPQGLDLIPTYLYSFKAAVPNFVPQETVPEPSAILGLISLGLGGLILKRQS
jgi:hypothetical protein